ncbi:MAG: hypothetical protein EF812_03065 [Methanosarcinales archaeon]|nr:MAG: hypothetical protein EF812_03065 [Methanosarcinales archaeon]
MNADPLLINERWTRAATWVDSFAIENSQIAIPIYQTDKESTMVMRTIEIKEIKYEVDKERRGGVISRLKELYRDQLDIFTEGDFVGVRGDLHNYKRRSRILWIMSGGKHGKDLPTC